MRVRQSTLGDFDACARRMQYSLESNTYHGGIVRAVGTAYHAGLERYYTDRMAHGWWSVRTSDVSIYIGVALEKLDATIAMKPSHISETTKVAGTFKFDDQFPDRNSAADAVSHMLTCYFAGEHQWPHDWNVLGVEDEFHLPLWGEHTQDGSYDLLLEHATTGDIVTVDNKTAGRAWPKGKEHPRKNNQGPWYTSAVMELFPDRPSYRVAFDIMTYKGVFERRVATPKPEHIEATRNKALQVVSLYTGLRTAGLDLPANPGSNLCNEKWCDHFEVCPHGRPLE